MGDKGMASARHAIILLTRTSRLCGKKIAWRAQRASRVKSDIPLADVKSNTETEINLVPLVLSNKICNLDDGSRFSQVYSCFIWPGSIASCCFEKWACARPHPSSPPPPPKKNATSRRERWNFRAGGVGLPYEKDSTGVLVVQLSG